ncbi:MAG: aspartate carbamoyltransferase catalytic subunit [Deltaproteobacteria bacterium]|nr:aspartate carbamoyltransferase catalytic subunit [Deltaproteobacteria bacterium]MBI2975221.1 aspartate carbamoyltransferase catalytic subunit [Deltaproteobacteria bacterium]
MTLSVKHILSARDLTKKDVDLILQNARALKEISYRPIKKVPTLRGKQVLLCFFEDSTRTRLSFDIAAKRLSADTAVITKSGSSMAKGETILDTIKNLAAMQADIIVIRHKEAGVPWEVAKAFPQISVINAGDGMHEHPTQALLDLMTIQDAKGGVAGLNVTIAGDIFHSRVARSNMILLKKMGAKVHVCAPKTFLPADIDKYGVAVHTRLENAVKASDVLMMLRIQMERQDGFFFPSAREYSKYFGLTREIMKFAKRDLVIMHPGPVNRGLEIEPEIADGGQSVILDQVENGVAVRMALLYLLCGGKEHE